MSCIRGGLFELLGRLSLAPQWEMQIGLEGDLSLAFRVYFCPPCG